jgi:hypothetical protein
MPDWPRASTIHAMAADLDAAYDELRAENEWLQANEHITRDLADQIVALRTEVERLRECLREMEAMIKRALQE